MTVMCGTEISRQDAPLHTGLAGCLTGFAALPDRLFMLTAASVVVGTGAAAGDVILSKEGLKLGVLADWTDVDAGEVTTDAALIQVDPALVAASIGTGGPPRGANVNPKVGDAVSIEASGRVGRGTITDLFVEVPLTVTGPNFTGQARYRNQILCSDFGVTPSIGSAVLDQNRNVVGLLVGQSGGKSVVTPINAILGAWIDGIGAPRLEMLDRVPSQAQAPSNAPAGPSDPQPGDPLPASTSAIAWGRPVGAAFKQKVIAICRDLDINPNHLMACIAFETGGQFRPDTTNENSGATGLIQFMPATAKGLHTTTDALRRMTAVEQLDVVKSYFEDIKTHFMRPGAQFRSLADLYMAILWPRAIGLPDDAVLFAAGSAAYRQNAGLDVSPHDLKVTKAEAAGLVAQRLAQGMKPPNFG